MVNGQMMAKTSNCASMFLSCVLVAVVSFHQQSLCIQSLQLSMRTVRTQYRPTTMRSSRAKMQILMSSNDGSRQNEIDNDAALMAKIRASDEDNVFMRWNLEDDALLYEGIKANIPIEDLCITLKRGYQGVKSRIRHLNNPKHKAYMRLFGTEAVSVKPSKSIFLRPCGDCIERIIWDPALDIKDFSFIYRDRFDGLFEKPCVAPNDNVKGKERMLVKAIPEHRIESIKYKQRVVWDKQDRMDLIFGSSPGLTAIALRGDEVEEGSESDGEQEGFDDDEEWSQDEWFVSTDGESESGSVDDESVSSWEVSDSRKAEVTTDESGDADGEWNVDLYVLTATPTIGSKRNLKIEDVIASYPAWLQSEREKVTAEEEKKYVIFCDLDGVLVDFEAGVQKIFKKKKTAEISPKLLWPRLATTPDFYSLLPWMPDGPQLWHSITEHNPTIITGCPRGAWAEKQKREWASRELGEDVKVITCMSKDKYKYCVDGAILIDDRDATRDSWEGAGGIFLLHESTVGTIQMLRDLGLKIPDVPDMPFPDFDDQE